jgi:hypothetical protein
VLVDKGKDIGRVIHLDVGLVAVVTHLNLKDITVRSERVANVQVAAIRRELANGEKDHSSDDERSEEMNTLRRLCRRNCGLLLASFDWSFF